MTVTEPSMEEVTGRDVVYVCRARFNHTDPDCPRASDPLPVRRLGEIAEEECRFCAGSIWDHMAGEEFYGRSVSKKGLQIDENGHARDMRARFEESKGPSIDEQIAAMAKQFPIPDPSKKKTPRPKAKKTTARPAPKVEPKPETVEFKEGGVSLRAVAAGISIVLAGVIAVEAVLLAIGGAL